ncbi:hypothetical protein [Actinomadura sp. HBU206391]|uniref:hypothetical protein n=1 Tax=Actinomadura sp. HBU206391 TaxID=2731692 RepID=UPI001650D3BF|nr:hypothetical protein [Actinomadura sp. HBU206391]MBC6456367.1 hypothetical protein [Actinomadura sp. HBU206391]
MTEWANLLIPAASVIAGGLVTGGLTLWGQALVNKGTHAREREARHDAFRVRQREIERDALLTLQDALGEHFRIWQHLRGTAVEVRPPESVDQFRLVRLKILSLISRVPNHVTEAVDAYCMVVYEDLDPETPGLAFEDVAHLLRTAQDLAGEALMRDL